MPNSGPTQAFAQVRLTHRRRKTDSNYRSR
jgi:hypothetical protein